MAKNVFSFREIERNYWRTRLNGTYADYKKTVKQNCERQGMDSQDACQHTKDLLQDDIYKVRFYRQCIDISMPIVAFENMKDYIQWMEYSIERIKDDWC